MVLVRGYLDQMAALADDKKAQLREWFASARRRSLPVVPVPFGLTAADLFARPASKSGGAFDPAWKSTSASGYPKNYCGVRYPKNYQYRLGVDFTAAREPFVLADVGVLPEIHGRPRKQTLRLAQQMTEGGIAGVLWNAGRALTFMLPRPVHKSNFRSASPPLLNHDLHAIDAAQARWPRLPEWREEGRFAGKVLELGTGTGLVGTACWLRGAREVAMTDLPAAIELARANVAANVGAAAGLRVEPLAWGAPLPAALAGPWDVVVAADCLYDVAALPALLRTLGEVSDARTVVYLAYKRRVDAREAPFFADLENLFDRVAFTAPEAVPAEWRGTGLHLCRATGRRQT